MEELSPEAFIRNMDNTPEGKIKQCRNKMGDYYSVVTKALDDPIKEFLASNNREANSNCRQRVFPAVDFAAGSAYFTHQLALRYREPLCDRSLEWYPTDTTDGLEKFTRPCLKYLAKEAESFLCTDRNGGAVFPRQRVELQGLKNDDYNGQEGVVLHKDPKTVGRYAIQLDSKAKPISFKADNFVRTDISDHSSTNNGNRFLVEGLRERSCNVDVLKRETWSDVLEKLAGQCALVTCTNLLTEIGHREPTAWKTVMELASELLVSGGYLKARRCGWMGAVRESPNDGGAWQLTWTNSTYRS